MATATVGKMRAFDPKGKSVVTYVEWVELVFRLTRLA